MELNYKKYGDQGPAIIILHGLLGSLDNWHTIARKLSKSYTVYTIDQRNHGRSPHADTFDYASMADDLLDFMEQHHIPEAHLIGHSMGGKTVMWFATDHPERVDKLIVVDMAPKEYKAQHTEILEALKAFPIDEIESRSEADKVMAKWIDNFGIRQFLLKNLQRDNKGGFRWKMNLPVIDREYTNMTEALPPQRHFNGPTLFIRGGQSGYIKDTDLQTIRKQFPQAELATIDKAGHWVHAEAPQHFLNEVVEYLDRSA